MWNVNHRGASLPPSVPPFLSFNNIHCKSVKVFQAKRNIPLQLSFLHTHSHLLYDGIWGGGRVSVCVKCFGLLVWWPLRPQECFLLWEWLRNTKMGLWNTYMFPTLLACGWWVQGGAPGQSWDDVSSSVLWRTRGPGAGAEPLQRWCFKEICVLRPRCRPGSILPVPESQVSICSQFIS